ncbi:MAG TPA: carboxypeptidase-like regulatory domain-containing protein [Longimicrobium sp.]|jgi:hypothetical protein
MTLALCAAGATLQAQTVPASGRENATPSGPQELEGRVLDARTGRPLPLATVEIPRLRRSTVTDDEGRFDFGRVPAGEHGIVVRLVGYNSHSLPVEARSGAPVEVRLAEDPVLLTGLTVTVNRFDRRTRSVPYSVHVHTKRDVYNSAARDAAEFVIRRANMIRTACRSMWQSQCFSIQGTSTEPRVYIDDVFMAGGMDILAVIPREDVNRVEVIRSGTVIRVYTDRFMEWAARSNYRPLPLAFN